MPRAGNNIFGTNASTGTLDWPKNFKGELSSFVHLWFVTLVGATFRAVRRCTPSLQEDEKFLSELFAQLTDEATDDDKRRDLVLFLKEFCTFSQTLQPQCRESFFKVGAPLLRSTGSQSHCRKLRVAIKSESVMEWACPQHRGRQWNSASFATSLEAIADKQECCVHTNCCGSLLLLVCRLWLQCFGNTKYRRLD